MTLKAHHRQDGRVMWRKALMILALCIAGISLFPPATYDSTALPYEETSIRYKGVLTERPIRGRAFILGHRELGVTRYWGDVGVSLRRRLDAEQMIVELLAALGVACLVLLFDTIAQKRPRDCD